MRLRHHGDLVARFADYQRFELSHTAGTVRMYVKRLGYVERLCGKPIYKVGADDLRALKRTADLSPESIKGLVVATHAFHRWGAVEGLWELNGVSLVRTPKVVSTCPPPLPVAKARVLLDSCRVPLEYRLVYLGLYAGMRIGESAVIAGPMWDDGSLRFRGLKGGRMREVPIHPELAEAKWDILAHPASYDSTLQRVKRRLEARVGFSFVAHQLRKTFATQLYDQGVDDRIVKQLLGHAPDVTARYVQVSGRRLREAIDLLAY